MMSKILRDIIDWSFQNEIVPEIYFSAYSGGIYLNLKLRKHGKCIAHEFYVGGVLCLENWDISGRVDDEVEHFIETAKKELSES